jgi:hypothetical protein
MVGMWETILRYMIFLWLEGASLLSSEKIFLLMNSCKNKTQPNSSPTSHLNFHEELYVLFYITLIHLAGVPSYGFLNEWF